MCSPALKFMMDVRHGLLDELSSVGLFGDEEMDQLMSEAKDTRVIERLMKYYTEMSHEQQQQFHLCLDYSGQSHVTRFIVNNGQQSMDGGDLWPLYACGEWNTIKRNRSRLIELVDSRHGLLDEMFKDDCINKRQYDSLSCEREDAERNAKLINILQRKSLRDYRTFLRCLEKTEQHHVVWLLEPLITTESMPIAEHHKSRLKANFTFLVQNIETASNGLLSHLLSNCSITSRQKGYIESVFEPAESNKRLLEVIQKTSQSKYENFIKCLNKTGQQHIAKVLNSDGVITQIIANISGVENVADIEQRIVGEFKELLRKSSEENRQKLLKNIFEHVELVGMKTHSSIKLFLFCRSLFGLQYLNDLYSADQLSTNVARAFNILLWNGQCDTYGDLVKVDRLVWEVSDYERCVSILSKTVDRHSTARFGERKNETTEGLELGNMSDVNDSENSPAVTLLSKSIESKRSGLLHLIDLHHGLLSQLRNDNTISEEQVSRISQKSTETDQAGQLLDEVVSLSADRQERFVATLEKTRQRHVVDRLMDSKIVNDEKYGAPWQFSNKRSRAKDPQWPLLYSEEWGYIDRNWCRFLEVVDCGCGLLEELLERGSINEQHVDEIKSTPIRSLQNLKLLQIFRRNSVNDFHKLLDSLNSTKQYYVKSLLNPQNEESTEPLTETQKMALHANNFALIEVIDATKTGSSLLDEMLSSDCITKMQKEYIKNAETLSEANARLLKIVEYGCQADFMKFVDCLRKTKNHEACSMLRGEGVCVCIMAKIVHKGEGQHSMTSKWYETIHAPNGFNYKTTLEGQGQGQGEQMIELMAVRTHRQKSSLKVFFRCRTPDGLHFLHLFHETCVLKVIIRKTLAIIDSACSLEIAQTEWKLAEYLTNAQFIYKVKALNCHAEIYRLAAESTAGFSKFPKWNSNINQLPFEMVQHILIKTVGQLFQVLHARSSQAVLCSIVTVMSVCRDWWDEVDSWKGVKYCIKRHLETASQPYRPTTNEVTRIERVNDYFYGVAQSRSKIYVICYSTSSLTTILVFAASSPYNLLNEIAAPVVLGGTDIAASNATDRLYVTGYLENCIWRINTEDEQNRLELFASVPIAPWTLSLNNKRLLVTFHGGRMLKIYNEDGEHISDIVLPKNIYAYHAKEAIDGTVIVCHQTIQPPGYSGITQFAISPEGSAPDRLRAFSSHAIGDVIQSTPFYLDVDRAGNVLLADRSKREVVLLKPTADKTYQKSQLLLGNTELHPMRLCYSEDTKLLCVCFYDLNSIRIYKA